MDKARPSEEALFSLAAEMGLIILTPDAPDMPADALVPSAPALVRPSLSASEEFERLT